jgi:hypothetical protein
MMPMQHSTMEANMGLNPIKSLLSTFVVSCKALTWEFLYSRTDVLSPYAAELALKRAALKDKKYTRVCPNVLYR